MQSKNSVGLKRKLLDTADELRYCIIVQRAGSLGHNQISLEDIQTKLDSLQLVDFLRRFGWKTEAVFCKEQKSGHNRSSDQSAEVQPVKKKMMEV